MTVILNCIARCVSVAVNGVYNINQLANTVNNILKEYSNGVGEKVEWIAETVAKRGAMKLKNSNLVPVLTGEYKTGWRAKKVGDKWVVHNATDYELTHLLEKGHAKVGGGRVAAKPHIGIVEQEMIKEFENEIRAVLSE